MVANHGADHSNSGHQTADTQGFYDLGERSIDTMAQSDNQESETVKPGGLSFDVSISKNSLNCILMFQFLGCVGGCKDI